MKRYLIFLFIIIIGLFMVSGCIEQAGLDVENESSTAVGSVVRQILEGYEDLNPPYEVSGRAVKEFNETS